MPDATIEMDGSFKGVLLVVKNDNCNTYVEEIVRAAPFPDEPAGGSLQQTVTIARWSKSSKRRDCRMSTH